MMYTDLFEGQQLRYALSADIVTLYSGRGFAEMEARLRDDAEDHDLW